MVCLKGLISEGFSPLNLKMTVALHLSLVPGLQTELSAPSSTSFLVTKSELCFKRP